MLGLIQRVSRAEVRVGDEVCGEIGPGLLLLLGVQQGDAWPEGRKLLSKILNYRVFNDEQGRMNLSLKDVQGGLLIVSQFTLAADTGRGLRPSFSAAAPPDQARALYEQFVQAAREEAPVAVGRFGADMQVALVNDGPVTFLLEASAG